MAVLTTLSFLLIILSGILQAVFILLDRDGPDKLSHWFLAVSAFLIGIFMIRRSFQIGFPALTGTFESLLFFSMAVCAGAFFYRLKGGKLFLPFVQFGLTLAALALLALASSPIAPRQALPPIPALRSYWLLAHVSLSFVGESFFVASFVASILFLLSRDADKQRTYDRIAYSAVALGYPIFTVGALVFGAVWAERAWGTWWSWDPKETWALITWLVYSLYLHFRLVRNRKDSLPSIIAIAAFLCTLFTFFGVNYLLSGLHSYG